MTEERGAASALKGRLADVYVPALVDGALEALAMGLPVIAGKRSGAAEILQPGRNGWTCDPADIAGLAQLLREAVVASGDNRLLAAARAAAEGYGIDDMARRLTQLYSELGR